MLKSTFRSHSLYQLIYEATDDLLESENESLNNQICSEILRSSDGPKIAAKIINKIINKSLSNRCYQSIWYCLLLLDLAVKNTDSRFCSTILSKDFFNDLIKIMDPKFKVPEFVQEKFLYIEKEWYESLTNVIGYQNLAKFHRSQMSSTSPNDLPLSSKQPYPVQQSLPYFPAPLQVNQSVCLDKQKIMKDVDIIETNLSIFSDTLCVINPREITAEECQFLKDLHDSLKRMQERINEVLPHMIWEDIINQLLQVNDKINSTSERYMRMVSLKIQQTFLTTKDQGVVNNSMQDIYDKSSMLTIEDNAPNVVSDIYDIPSLPSYIEASSFLNKTNISKPSQELNLINFDEEVGSSFCNKQIYPALPVNDNIDLLTEPLPMTGDNTSSLSSDDFDSFIDSIARRHQKVPEAIPEEGYAPPLYDEALSKNIKHQ